MFEGNNNNTAVPPFLNIGFQYPANASNQLQLCGNREFFPANVSNQLQLCGNLPVEFHPDPVNYLGNNTTVFLQPNKCEAIPSQQQLLQLNNESLNNVADNRKASIIDQNSIFTDLRLACDDDEQTTFLTSASRGQGAESSILSSDIDIKRELNQQNEELNHFIRTQEENMMSGLRDIRERHTVSFLSALEKSVTKKLWEKDFELETVNLKNKELVEKIRHVTKEAQNWHRMAKYNESVANVLKTNLQQAMQSSNRQTEGFGESNADDAASCIDPNNYLSTAGGCGRSSNTRLICRSCKSKTVSMLLMPCRHLCVCKECESFVNVCPVCQMRKTSSLDVYLS